MWHARREALRIRGSSLRELFLGWMHVTRYHAYQKQIRKFSRANKRLKLEYILSEGADLALRGQTFEWCRKIRQLCPKQTIRRIHMFDMHGMPLHPSQEIQLIEQYYTVLYSDENLPSFRIGPLTCLPFDCQEMAKALSTVEHEGPCA